MLIEIGIIMISKFSLCIPHSVRRTFRSCPKACLSSRKIQTHSVDVESGIVGGCSMYAGHLVSFRPATDYDLPIYSDKRSSAYHICIDRQAFSFSSDSYSLITGHMSSTSTRPLYGSKTQSNYQCLVAHVRLEDTCAYRCTEQMYRSISCTTLRLEKEDQ